jgi:hypothetical protein
MIRLFIPDPGVKKAPDPGSATLIPYYADGTMMMNPRVQEWEAHPDCVPGPDPGSDFFPFRIRIKDLSIITQKIVSKLSEI